MLIHLYKVTVEGDEGCQWDALDRAMIYRGKALPLRVESFQDCLGILYAFFRYKDETEQAFLDRCLVTIELVKNDDDIPF